MDRNTLIIVEEDHRQPTQSAPEHHSDDSPSSSDNGDFKKQLLSRPNRDPMSHRIIEKRRRDRMNNCLTNLSKLIPSAYLKKGRGRIEKTEIIEMAIRYMKHMQEERKQISHGGSSSVSISHELMKDKAIGTEDSLVTPSGIKHATIAESRDMTTATVNNLKLPAAVMSERYKQGFYDCIAETLRFLALSEGLQINEISKTRLLLHLKDYFSRITYDTLTASISDLLHPPSTSVTATSVLSLPWTPIHKGSGNFAYDSSSSSSPSPKKEEQPLNMSLKRARMDLKPGTSHLRDILTDTKGITHKLDEQFMKHESPGQPPNYTHLNHQATPSIGAPETSCSVKRPHVFRYTSGLNMTPGDSQPHNPSPVKAPLLLSANGVLPFPAHHNQCNSSASSGSTQYPSSPGSNRSFSGGSYAGDSPPRVVSPPASLPAATHAQNQGMKQKLLSLSAPLAGLPIFALHPSGLYYIPMTLNPANLEPSILHQLATSSVGTACHPVTITVNFCHSSNNHGNLSSGTNHSIGRQTSLDPQNLVVPGREGVILAAASSTNT